MDNFRNFNQLRSPQLWLIRHGFWNAYYELSDGQFTYGKLSHKGMFNQKTIIETLNNTWEFTGKSISGFKVNTPDGEFLGETENKFFSLKPSFIFKDGFKATYLQPSFWKSANIWADETETELMKITANPFSSKGYTIDLPKTNLDNEKILLLIFIGIKLTMNRQKAAAV